MICNKQRSLICKAPALAQTPMSDLLKRNLRRSLEAASNCWKLLQNFNRRITIAICHRALTLITPRPLCQFNRIMNVTRFEKCHRTFGITEQPVASIPILCHEVQPLSLLPTCLGAYRPSSQYTIFSKQMPRYPFS